MMRWLLGWIFSVLASVAAQAQTEALPPPAIATKVPIEVAEVAVGGTWTDGASSGIFRTVTVQRPGEPVAALVFLQWIGSRRPVDPVELLVSLPVTEFNMLGLPAASVSIEADTDGEARISIEGQENEQNPVRRVTLLATTPGHYKILPQVNAIQADQPAAK